MARTRTKPTSTTGTAIKEPAASANGGQQAGEPPPPVVVPVSTGDVPEPIRRLTWLQRIILTDAYLRAPRKFLCECTHTREDAALYDTQPKATKHTPYSELRSLLDVILPDDSNSTRFASNRRIQRSFLLSKLNELPADELETAVVRVVSTLLPPAQASDKTAQHAAQSWASRKTSIIEHVRDVITDIEGEIFARLTEKQRHPDIVVTADLPTNSLLTFHSETDLYWTDLAQPRLLTAIAYDDLPQDSPLRRLDIQRLPKPDKTGAGRALVILGASVPATIQALPRAFYTLRCVEEYTKFGWGVWSKRHRTYLDMNRETETDYQRFVRFEELLKKPWQTLWPYPALPTPPEITGFANRSLYAWDALARYGSYIARPQSQHSLADLLTARRVLVDEGSDQYPQHIRRSAATWVGKWFTPDRRVEILESMWALAKSAFESVEQIETDWRDHALGAFQAQMMAEGKYRK